MKCATGGPGKEGAECSGGRVETESRELHQGVPDVPVGLRGVEEQRQRGA